MHKILPTRAHKALAAIFGVLLIDQLVKIWIKTHMYLGEEIHVFGDWFRIHFTENPGMAFGWEIGGDYGKIILSVFRIIAVGAIGYYMWTLIKQKAKTGLIIAIALIFAGALGNILDSAFFGLLFSESGPNTIAEGFPAGGGYESFLWGRVVDMLYFPLFSGTFPDWLPLWGGEQFEFFRPIFNIADVSISVGVGMLLVFQRRYFHKGLNPILEGETRNEHLNQDEETKDDTSEAIETETTQESTQPSQETGEEIN